MQYLGFAIAVLGALLWVAAVALAFPRLLARLVCVLAKYATPAVRLSIRTFHLYPLSGSIFIYDVTASTGDASLSLAEVVFTCRWWRPWRCAHLAGDRASVRRHTYHGADHIVPEDSPRSGQNPAATFPAVLVVAVAGLQARVVNNSAAYNAFYRIIDIHTGTDLPLRCDASTSDSLPQTHTVSLIEWACSHTSLRIATGAIYIRDVLGDEADSGSERVPLVRVLFDAAKARYSTLPTAVPGHVRRSAARVSITGLRVGVGDRHPRDGGRELAGAGSFLTSSRALWFSRQRKALKCVEILTAQSAVVDYLADEPGSNCISSGDGRGDAGNDGATHLVVPVASMDVTLDGARFVHHQESISAGQDAYERLFPPLRHLTCAARSFYASDPSRVPMVVRVEAAPSSSNAPLISVPYVPRESTWHKLHSLGVRQWHSTACDGVTANKSQGGKGCPDGEDGRSEPVLTCPTLPLASYTNVFASKLSAIITIPQVLSGFIVRAEVTFNDLRVLSVGVVSFPLLRSPLAVVVYEEAVPEVWNEPHVASLAVTLDSPRVLYIADFIRTTDEVFASIAAHARIAESIGHFVPYVLEVTIEAQNSYTIRCGVESANAWPDISCALDCTHCVVAECRGTTGSVVIKPNTSLRHMPLVTSSKWRVLLPGLQVFLLFPMASSRMHREVNGAPDGDERSLSMRVDDNLDSPSFAVEQPKRFHAFCIASFPGNFSVSGESSLCMLSLPQTAEREDVRIQADVGVFDVNPYHSPYITALFDNLVANMTPAISFEEREILRSRRGTVAAELLSIERLPSRREAIVLGLDVGRANCTNSRYPTEELSFVRADVVDVTIRLHAVPSADCPMSNQAQEVSVVHCGRVELRSESSKSGAFIEVKPAASDQAARLSPAAKAGPRAGDDLPYPFLSFTGWRLSRHMYLDPGGAPYYISSAGHVGVVRGTLPVGNFLGLTRFASSFRVTPLSEVPVTLNALQAVTVIRAVADEVDVVLPLCDADLLRSAPGFCRVVMSQGLQVCTNNLSTAETLGHSSAVVPKVSLLLLATASPFELVRLWRTEDDLRAMIALSDAASCTAIDSWQSTPLPLKFAANIAQFSFKVSHHERPVLWSSGVSRLQAERLRQGDTPVPRVPYLWTANSPCIFGAELPGHELDQSAWWHYAKIERGASASDQGVLGTSMTSSSADEGSAIKVDLLTGVTVIVGPRALDIGHQFLRIPHALRDADGSLANDGQVCRSDLLNLWRIGRPLWSAPVERSFLTKKRITLSVTSFALTVLSPLSQLLDVEAGSSRSKEVEFGVEHARDKLVVSLPVGMRLVCSAQELCQPTKASGQDDKESYTLLLATLPCIRISADVKEIMLVNSAKVRFRDFDSQAVVDSRGYRLSVDSVRVGDVHDDLATLSSVGRMLSVYGLMTRAIGLEIGEISRRDRFQQARTSSLVFGTKSLFSLGKSVSSARAASMLADTIYSIDTGGPYVSELVSIVCDSSMPHVCPNLFAIPTSLTPVSSSPRHSIAAVSGLRKETRSHVLSANVLSPHPVLSTGVQNGCRIFSLHVTFFHSIILGEAILSLKDLRVDTYSRPESVSSANALRRGDGVASIITLDSLSVAVRDDVVAGILSVATSIASHTTAASAYLPILTLQDHASQPANGVLRVASLLSSNDVHRQLESEGNAPDDGQQRNFRAHRMLAKSIRSMRYRSSLPQWYRSRGIYGASGVGISETSSVDTMAVTASDEDSKLYCQQSGVDAVPKKHWNWIQKAAHAAEAALSSATGGVVFSERAKISNSRETVDDDGSEGARISCRGGMTVVVSSGSIVVSYKHRAGGGFGRVREPDLRVVMSRSSASVVVGASSMFQSVLCSARAVSLMARNEYDCTFQGSLSKVNLCVSVSPARASALRPMLIVSVRFSGIDFSLEAADLRAVSLFQDQFMDDIKNVGESMVITNDAVRAMLRATQLESLFQTSASPQNPIPVYGTVAVDISLLDVSASLLGFHPGDKAMRMTHDANRMFGSAVISEDTAAVLMLGARVHGHSLVASASHWSSEERFNFPGLEVCGVQWSGDSGLPTQLEMTAIPLANQTSLQGVRNMLFAASGLLAFHNQSRSGGPECGTDHADTRPLSTNFVSRVDIAPGSTLFRAMKAWERTKAVRMEMRVQPMLVGLVSGAVIALFEVGELSGVVEWNKLVTSGVQLHSSIQIPKVSLKYARLEADGSSFRTGGADDTYFPNSSVFGPRRDDASLAVDFMDSHLDVLKAQDASKQKYVVRLKLGSIQSVLQPWQFMEDAAVWADEQDFIREVQAMHLDVAASATRHTAEDVSPDAPVSNDDYLVLQFGLEVGLTRLQVPLLAEERRSSSRLSLECREFVLFVWLGDQLARKSHLAKVRIRSLGILWRNKDLFNSSQAQLFFALFHRPQHALRAHLGALHASISLGSWVLCPRQEVVLAFVDARLSREVMAAREARDKLASISEYLTQVVKTSTTGLLAENVQVGDGGPLSLVQGARLLFESVQVLVLPSPGYIEGLDAIPQKRPGRADGAGTPSVPKFSNSLRMPIPLFSVGLVRSPSYAFDLIDVSFAKATREEFPSGVLVKMSKLFSELFGAVASRTTEARLDPSRVRGRRSLFSGPSSTSSLHSDTTCEAPNTRDGNNVRDWSALVRFSEARYVARENVWGKLKTSFSFFAGKGAGVLASTISPLAAGNKGEHISGKVTVVSAASPLFKLEIRPELESAGEQSLTFTGVKVVQGYAKCLAPHTTVRVAEVKAELDVMTLLLSQEWMMRKGGDDNKSTSSSAENADFFPRRSAMIVTPRAQQAALALASAAPTETRVIAVLGEALRPFMADENDGVQTKSSGHAVLVRLRLSQPDGRVGLVVKRVHMGIYRHSAARCGDNRGQILTSDLHFAVYHATSRADWEHLSCDYGFRSLQICGDMSNSVTRARSTCEAESRSDDVGEDLDRTAGLVVLVQKLRFKCRRGVNDALKLETAAAATVVRVDASGCALLLETTGVDAYISSSTVKTINRLRQLRSRLIRGLRPQVERLLLAEMRRETSRISASMDSLSFPTSLSQHFTRQEDVDAQRLMHEDGGDGTRNEQTDSKLPKENERGAPGAELPHGCASFAGQIIVTGDLLVVTMHGFSFEDNQPQAKLLFQSHSIDYRQSRESEGGLAVVKRLGLEFVRMEIQYSDQRQHSVTVMSLPNPHMVLAIAERGANKVEVDFVTQFDNPVDASPYVSHYDYLRQLLSLYRSVSISSLARTLSAMEGDDGGGGGGMEGGADADGDGSRTAALSPAAVVTSSGDRVRWGGQEVTITRLVFGPRLRALGDLTPDVQSVLGWLGVGGVEALPAGLFDLIVAPASAAVDKVGEGWVRIGGGDMP
jgi:hypothetical protein